MSRWVDPKIYVKLLPRGWERYAYLRGRVREGIARGHVLINNTLVDLVVGAFQEVYRTLLEKPKLSRAQSQVPGTDLYVVGYRLAHLDDGLRFDVREYHKK